jgi:hypothetical protein
MRQSDQTRTMHTQLLQNPLQQMIQVKGHNETPTKMMNIKSQSQRTQSAGKMTRAQSSS